MRLTTSILSLFLAAGLASAAPMRVVLLSEPVSLSGPSQVKGNLRILPVEEFTPGQHGRRPCPKMSMSNSLRKALGLETIKDFKATVIGPPTGISFDRETYEGHTKGGDRIKVIAPRPRTHDSAMARIHRALMMLGPWEGRAVTFVFGCGLGVLLRIAFMAVLLSYRAFFSSNEKEEMEAEEYIVAPPNYNYELVDEKSSVIFEVVEVEETEQARK